MGQEFEKSRNMIEDLVKAALTVGSSRPDLIVAAELKAPSQMSPSEAPQIDPACPDRTAISRLTSLSELQWSTQQVKDLGQSPAKLIPVVCAMVDGVQAELQVAGALVALKSHAARAGCAIDFKEQKFCEGYYLTLHGVDEKSQKWLEANSSSYGIKQTLDKADKIVPTLYFFDPESLNGPEAVLSEETLKGNDLYSRIRLAQKNGAEFSVPIEGSEFKSTMYECLALGIVPRNFSYDAEQGFKASIKCDAKVSATVIECLNNCKTDYYSPVTVHGSIYKTLKAQFSETKDQVSFDELYKNTLAINKALLGIENPDKMAEGAIICVPGFACSHSSSIPVPTNSQTPITPSPILEPKPETAVSPVVNQRELYKLNFTKDGNPAFAALALSVGSNFPARGGGNCGAGTASICQISPLGVLDKIASRDAKDSNGLPYYPNGRHAVCMARYLNDLSQLPGSGIIAVKISKPEEAPTGSIICYPSNAGRFEIGNGEGSDKFGHIEIALKINGKQFFVYDLITQKPAAGKASNMERALALAKKGEFYAYVSTQSYLPSVESADTLAEKHNIKGHEEEIAIVSKRLESGNAGPGAVSRSPKDPGGASYGSHQLSSTKGTLAQFINFCIKSEEYKAIGQALADSGGLETKAAIPVSFDEVWKSQATNEGARFMKAQQDFIEQRYVAPAMARAERFGFNSESLALKNFLCSVAVQYGVPTNDKPLGFEDNKFDEIFNTAKDSLPKGADNLLEISTLLAARDGVLWRMGVHKINNGKEQTGRMYQKIVQNRYQLEEAALLRYLAEFERSKAGFAGNAQVLGPAKNLNYD